MSLEKPPSADVVPSGRSVSNRPLVSVVMSMRNSAATVGMAIRSIQLQTLQNWELIVIDDGSSDASVLIVGAINDSRIRLICETSCAGLAARLNQAVALSRGRFVARMDADDICFPDRLACQTTYLRQNPHLDLVGCGAVVFANDEELIGELPIGLTHEEIIARPFHGFPLPHPTWCGRTEWFRKNPYDSKLMKAEDQDLLLRTFRSSKLATLETILFAYRQNQLDLSKLLPGRRTYTGSLWRHARRSGEFLPVLWGIATHLFKSAVDITLIGFGLNRRAQQIRLKPVSSPVLQQWQDLQRDLQKDLQMQPVPTMAVD